MGVNILVPHRKEETALDVMYIRLKSNQSLVYSYYINIASCGVIFLLNV